MAKPQYAYRLEQLTDEIVAGIVESKQLICAYDRQVPGLSLRGPNTLGQYVWFFQSVRQGTPALGLSHRLDLAEAREKASGLGQPSKKALATIARIAATPVASAPRFDPKAKQLETTKALVDELIDARFAVMKPKMRDFIRDEIAKGIELALRERG